MDFKKQMVDVCSRTGLTERNLFILAFNDARDGFRAYEFYRQHDILPEEVKKLLNEYEERTTAPLFEQGV